MRSDIYSIYDKKAGFTLIPSKVLLNVFVSLLSKSQWFVLVT